MIRKSILAAHRHRRARRCRARSDLRFGVGLKGGWGHHGWGHGFGFYGVGFYGAGYVDVAPSCYYVKKIIRFGEVRLIKVCE